MFYQSREKMMFNPFNLVWIALVIPLLVGAGLSIILSIYLIRKPLAESSRIGVLLLMAGAWWATAYALELLSAGLEAKLFWAKIEYIGIILFPIASLTVGLIYSNHSHYLTRWRLILLTALGFVFLLLVFTTDSHLFFWRRVILNAHTTPPTLKIEYGPGFWAFMVYASLLTWTGLGLLLYSFAQSPVLHRRHIRVLVISVCIFVSAIIANALDIGIGAYIDLKPYAILVICFVVGWGSYRVLLGDIVPVAYLAIIDNIPDAVIILNSANRIVKLNIAAQKLFGRETSECSSRLFLEDYPDFSKIYNNNPADLSAKIELSLCNHGTQSTFEVQRSPILDGRGHVASQLIIIHDITERIQAERDRVERHRYLQAVWSSVPDAIIVLDADRKISEWSVGAERILDIPAESAIGLPLTALTECCTETDFTLQSFLDTVWDRNTITFVETQLSSPDKSSISVLVSGSPVIIDNELHGAVIVFTDITRLKASEISLRELNEELEQRVAERTLSLSEINKKLAEEIALHQETEQSLVQRNRELLSFQAAATATSSSLDMVFVLETLAWEMIDLLEVDGCCVYQLSPETAELTAIADYAALIANEPTPEKCISLKDNEVYSRVIYERYAKFIKSNGKTPELDPVNLLLIPMIFQDKVVGLVELNYTDPDRILSERQISLGQLLASQAAIAMENADLYKRAQQEIQERERAENQIKTSLKEKEMLLQEIHHRVKNNLQVISSLLSLQSRNVRDEETLTILRESQDRIRSMALIHEKLYRSENLARIDFAGYLQSLASHLVRSYRSSMGIARLHMDVADVSLSLETAVPCGLIVNELVSNALKHAFSDGRQGTIRITLRKEENKQITLSVADDGVGLPDGFDIYQSDSLGLRLVTMLVGQVKGELITTNEHGAKFEVVFPHES
jgi:PAS domain S-box-containing protein